MLNKWQASVKEAGKITGTPMNLGDPEFMRLVREIYNKKKRSGSSRRLSSRRSTKRSTKRSTLRSVKKTKRNSKRRSTRRYRRSRK